MVPKHRIETCDEVYNRLQWPFAEGSVEGCTSVLRFFDEFGVNETLTIGMRTFRLFIANTWITMRAFCKLFGSIPL